ncbi:MAG: DEAD/DEAH box helicase [Microbacteriaceae bacterium]|nr:DEAD/DEAH box helicase [Microbacteriaceae bacterium]
MNPDGPLIVQSDRTVLLEVQNPSADAARHALAVFAELERAPEHMHTYRITRLGLWNARAAGHTAEEIIATLEEHSKFPLPPGIVDEISDTIRRYGQIEITREGENLFIACENPTIEAEITRTQKIAELLGERDDQGRFPLAAWSRGLIKQELLKKGWPASDHAGFTEGEPHDIGLTAGEWSLRDYQLEAVRRFAASGSGVVVLPCGAGKTLVGAGVMAELDTTTLILVTNTVSARQWRAELLARTSLTEDEIGEYSGSVKEIKPVTIASYSIMAAKRKGEFAHLGILDAKNWGLVVYDEVHLLPAPVFQLTAQLQARRRLGLTATLVREDGREGDVFSLIGPKRFDVPWKQLEAEGYIAPATCVEIRLELPAAQRLEYASSTDKERFRLASTSPSKSALVSELLALHPDDPTLIIGTYLEQIEALSEGLEIPMITGDTPVPEREELYQAFRSGAITRLVVSKVANFSIDLPEASVAIQVSGSFGSRQEEAQRLGRILRPKADGRPALFYTLVARDTVDQDFALNRQRFLAEQGYGYTIMDAAEVTQKVPKILSDNIQRSPR